MTKADLVTIIARKTGQEKANVAATVDAFFEAVKTSLTEGETICLRGFGNFERRHRAARKARNIKKNIEIRIPASNYPAFKPYKGFVDQIKNGKGGQS